MYIKPYISKILVLVGILLVANIVWGFVEPSANPPSSNVPAPINVGPVKQVKEWRSIAPPDTIVETGSIGVFEKVSPETKNYLRARYGQAAEKIKSY